MPGIYTAIKKPIGKIKMVKFYKSPRGVLYYIDQILDYYSILTTSGCNCTGLKNEKRYKKKNCTIPFSKSDILK
jgi:hypothetical protein